MSSGEPERILLVSDLHMSAGRGATGPIRRTEHFREDEALVAFLGSLVERTRGGERPRLVLLGDIFDFIDAERQPGAQGHRPGSAAAGMEALDRICAAHPEAFGALASVANACDVELVPGNHDQELHHPEVRGRLRELLGGAPIGFHPWIFRVPGRLHAEHGHQHHDINALPSPVATIGRDGAVGQPLAAWVHRAGMARYESGASRALRTARAAAGAAVALGGLAGPVRRSARRRLRDQLAPEAARLDLDPQTLARLDGLSDFTLTGIARRALRTARERRGRSAPMHDAIARVHAILAAAGEPARVYVTGHTHVPERVAIAGEGDAPAAVYVGCGTWSTFRAGRDLPHLTFAEIDAAGGGAGASLMRFDPDTGSAERLA